MTQQNATYEWRSSQFVWTIKQTIAEIVSSTPTAEALEVDLPENIPPTPAPGIPEKLAQFSRSMADNHKYSNDKQVLRLLVHEGKVNQYCVDHWKNFIRKKGMKISIHI